MANSSGSKKTDYRSAKTGEFVTEQYAKKHPDTTVKERNPRPASPPKKGK